MWRKSVLSGRYKSYYFFKNIVFSLFFGNILFETLLFFFETLKFKNFFVHICFWWAKLVCQTNSFPVNNASTFEMHLLRLQIFHPEFWFLYSLTLIFIEEPIVDKSRIFHRLIIQANAMLILFYQYSIFE